MTDRELIKYALNTLIVHQGLTRPLQITGDCIEKLQEALAQPEPIQVRPAEFIAAASIGVGADVIGMPMIWAEWPTPKSSTVRWSIPVDPNNFGEPVAQPDQEQLVHDQITYGMNVTLDGKRIDPTSIYKDPEQTPVSHLWECIGRWSAYLATNGEKAFLSPPTWLVDAVKGATAPPTKPWVGLTDDEIDKCDRNSIPGADSLFGRRFYKAIEAKLKERNNVV
jgi:hypothetical protein